MKDELQNLFSFSSSVIPEIEKTWFWNLMGKDETIDVKANGPASQGSANTVLRDRLKVHALFEGHSFIWALKTLHQHKLPTASSTTTNVGAKEIFLGSFIFNCRSATITKLVYFSTKYCQLFTSEESQQASKGLACTANRHHRKT